MLDIRCMSHIGHITHFNYFEVTFATTIQGWVFTIFNTGVACVCVVNEFLAGGWNSRSSTGFVGSHQLSAISGYNNRTSPYVIRRQVQVKVQHFAAVLAFQKTNLDRLGGSSGVHYRQVGVIAGTHGVVRINQNLAKAVRINVHRTRGTRNANRTQSSQNSCIYRLPFKYVHHYCLLLFFKIKLGKERCYYS